MVWIPILIAFLSGACALIYEIVWMRLFTPVFGLTVYATTTVLCAFMAGLGTGSIIAPRIISRWRGSPWTLYGIVELGIAVSVLCVPLTIPHITDLYVRVSQAYGSDFMTAAVRFLSSFVVMLVPTLFMGMTLPIITRATVPDPQSREGAARIGYLYGFNTAGAAIGCALVGFLLLYLLGVSSTTKVTATFNALLGLGALAAGRALGGAPVEESRAKEQAVRGGERSGLGILVLYAFVGFAAFGYELCWFRLLVFFLQSATYSFCIMLTLFLLGGGVGSIYFARVMKRRLELADESAAWRVFTIVQCLIALLGVCTVQIYRDLGPLWAAMVELFGAETNLSVNIQKTVVAGCIILPSTFLMGVTFPLLAYLYGLRQGDSARVMGYLYGSSTAGAVSGCLAVGFVLFGTIGLQSTLLLLSLLSLACGLSVSRAGALRSRGSGWAIAGLLGLYAVVLAVTPANMLVKVYERYEGRILFYRESASDITMVTENGPYKALIFHDGRGASNTMPITNHVGRLLAYSAMASKPDARDVLVISMGCGNTASAFASFPIRSLDIVDISSGPFEAARFFETNKGVLNDPRVRVFVQDGRNYLLTTPKKYDLIHLELPSIHTEGVVSLYTKEFYEVAKKRLNPGGLLSQWIDALQAGREASYMMIRTMLEVFPRSTAWAKHWAWWINGVLEPGDVHVDYATVGALFSDERVREDMDGVDSGLKDVMATLVGAGDALREAVKDAEILTDDRTIVDLEVPYLDNPYAFGGGVAYMNSPLRQMFLDSWERSGLTALRDLSMFPFYDEQDHRRLVDEALELVARGFPPEVLADIELANDDWS